MNDLVIIIGDYRFYPARNRLTSPRQARHLTPKMSRVLLHLARHAGETVTREQLLNAAWHGKYASDELLNRAIADLRQAFDDSFRSPSYIETIPKVGYRLMVSVRVEQPESDAVEPAEIAALAADPTVNGDEPAPVTAAAPDSLQVEVRPHQARLVIVSLSLACVILLALLLWVVLGDAFENGDASYQADHGLQLAEMVAANDHQMTDPGNRLQDEPRHGPGRPGDSR